MANTKYFKTGKHVSGRCNYGGFRNADGEWVKKCAQTAQVRYELFDAQYCYDHAQS